MVKGKKSVRVGLSFSKWQIGFLQSIAAQVGDRKKIAAVCYDAVCSVYPGILREAPVREPAQLDLLDGAAPETGGVTNTVVAKPRKRPAAKAKPAPKGAKKGARKPARPKPRR